MSWFPGFSLWWLFLLCNKGSRQVAFSSCGFWALQRGLCCSTACGIFADWGSDLYLLHTGDRRDSGSIPGSGRSPGGGNGNPIQYSGLENPMNRGGQWVIAHGVAKSQTQLNTHAYTHTRKTPLLLLKSEKKNFKQLLFLLCFFPDYTHLKVLPTFRNLSCISFLLVLAIPFCPVTQTASRPSP